MKHSSLLGFWVGSLAAASPLLKVPMRFEVVLSAERCAALGTLHDYEQVLGQQVFDASPRHPAGWVALSRYRYDQGYIVSDLTSTPLSNEDGFPEDYFKSLSSRASSWIVLPSKNTFLLHHQVGQRGTHSLTIMLWGSLLVSPQELGWPDITGVTLGMLEERLLTLVDRLRVGPFSGQENAIYTMDEGVGRSRIDKQLSLQALYEEGPEQGRALLHYREACEVRLIDKQEGSIAAPLLILGSIGYGLFQWWPRSVPRDQTVHKSKKRERHE